jgi:hypothetical protein
MKYGTSVKGVRPLGGFRLRLVFADGYIGEVDLAPLFDPPHGPLTAPFKDPSYFQNAFVDADAVAWPNGFDICPDVLRFYCEQGQVCSREELENAFRPQPADTPVLHDKPKNK